MIELGKVQELEIVRTKEFGVYLSEKAGDDGSSPSSEETGSPGSADRR